MLSVSVTRPPAPRSPFSSDSPRYNFKKANFILLYDSISKLDWAELHLHSDVNRACEHFYSRLYSAVDPAVPKTKLNQNSGNFPAWFTPELIHDVKAKNNMRAKFLRSGSVTHLERYKASRATLKLRVHSTYTAFIASRERAASEDPSTFWSYVNSLKGGSRIPTAMSRGDVTYDKPEDVVNAFADYFSSVYRAAELGRCFTHQSASRALLGPPVPEINVADVTHALKSLKPKLSSGTDQTPNLVVRDCAYAFAAPLCFLFNLSLKMGVFPDCWKSAKVSPVHKSGDKSQLTNYRPIALISAFVKVYESCLYSHIFKQVPGTITPFQHGFMPDRSTTTNLAVFTHAVCGALDRGEQLDVIYTDFAKAFDTIDHGILPNKLSACGLHASVVSLLASYLSNRVYMVELHGRRSKPFIGSHRVFHRGPTLDHFCLTSSLTI